MLQSENTYRFFIGATTPNGFVSYTSELANENEIDCACLVKGGAGSGKSTFIKKAASALANGSVNELIYCSLDPESLDAALICDGKLSLIDATAPHTIEPKISGAFENVVSLYDFFDTDFLRANKDKIATLRREEEMLKERSRALIRAAGMLLSSNESLASRCLDIEKLTNYITRVCIREFKDEKGKQGTVKNRFLSAVTQNGIMAFTDTINKMCDRAYVIDDTSGAASSVICEAILKTAVKFGYDAYACHCPMSITDRIDHVLIPKLRLAFVTSNSFHPITLKDGKIVHTARFYNKDLMHRYSNRARFQMKAAKQLLAEAAGVIALTLKKHKEIEKYYVGCCDFAARERYFKGVISQLSKQLQNF